MVISSANKQLSLLCSGHTHGQTINPSLTHTAGEELHLTVRFPHIEVEYLQQLHPLHLRALNET